jgi:ADP-heptose:LPS heptosyltransferase
MDRRNVDIVLVRMDKIGDLVVSLPVDEHPVFAGRRVHWFISKGLSFVTEQAQPKRTAHEFKRRFSPFEFWRMLTWLREQRPQTVVLLHSPWWVSFAAWLAGVPERMGRLSQWHSFLWLNIPIRQKRSASDRHESDFNFDLVEYGFNHLGVRRADNLGLLKRTFLRLTPPNPFATLAARGLKTRSYRVVHPGMGGSALNWPTDSFRELIERLSHETPVVITGTKADRKYLEGLKSLTETHDVRWLVNELKPMELLDLLSQARSVIGPSTGVLHLSASLGTPTVGIYSPRKVEHPRRWGPKGLQVTALLPPVQEGENFAPDVMRNISPDQVYVTAIGVENGHVRSDAPAFTRI